MSIEDLSDEEFVARTLEAATRLAYQVTLGPKNADLVSSVLYGRSVVVPHAAVTVPPGMRHPRRDDTLLLYSPRGSAVGSVGITTPEGIYVAPAFWRPTAQVPFRYVTYRHPDDRELYEAYSPDCGRLGSGASAREAKEQLADRIIHAVREHHLTAPDYVRFANGPDADRWTPKFVSEGGVEAKVRVVDRDVLHVGLPCAYWSSLATATTEKEKNA